MSYGRRVVIVLSAFFALTLAFSVYVIFVSNYWASDAIGAGHGSVDFPPQQAAGAQP